jgi:hypothetical protein
MATAQLGDHDARIRANNVTRWTGVVVLSAKPLSLPKIRMEVLGNDLALRYRYTGLRLLIEDGGRYFVVPLGWNPRTQPVYVIRESDKTWIGLMPGTQPGD